jgi:hypothetical protein
MQHLIQVRERLAQWPNVVDKASAEVFVAKNVKFGARLVRSV